MHRPHVHDGRTQIIAIDTTDAIMYAWSTKWYTTNNVGATIEHTSSIGEYNQTDEYEIDIGYGYQEATGLVIHPTTPYFYVSEMPVTECHANESRMHVWGKGSEEGNPMLLAVPSSLRTGRS